MGKKVDKTNVMQILDQKGIEYNCYSCDNSKVNAVGVAKTLNQDPSKVFKTLVTVGKSKEHYVFMIPSIDELA